PGNRMLKSALYRFHEAAWKRKRIGLSKKQVADEEVEQLGLIIRPGRIENVGDAERLSNAHAAGIGGKLQPIDRLSGPAPVKEKIRLIEIDEPLVFHLPGN